MAFPAVPCTQPVVRATADQHVESAGDGENAALVSIHGVQTRPGREVPETQGPIGRAGCAAVWGALKKGTN